MTHPTTPDSRADASGPVGVIGATSAMARAAAAEMAAAGHPLVLAARDGGELEAVAADLRLRHGVSVRTVLVEALAFETHPQAVEEMFTAGGNAPEGVLVFLGHLGDAELAAVDAAEARRIVDTNFTACVSLLTPIAERMAGRGRGWICVVSSVAGERGRQSNYVYGAAKAGLTTYLQGLRNRLHHRGVHVVTVIPGFVDTRMTFGKPGTFLVASPERVARGIRRAVERRRNVVYLPGFWRLVMLGIRSVPEGLFKRLRL